MASVSELQQQIAAPNLTHEERTLLRCRLAKSFEDAGNFKAARDVLAKLWPHVGARPALDGLSMAASSELLLRTGALIGWIGSAGQIEDSQETAKNLISESLTRFEESRITKKAAEARMELGTCYWREGAFDEARVMMQEALYNLTDADEDLKATAVLRLAMVENVTYRLRDAFNLLTNAVRLFERSENHTLKGRFHNQYAQALRRIGEAERRDDLIDRALIEYAAACYHFEQAGHSRYQACVENNLGFLFGTLGRYEEAHEHLDRAQALMTCLRDMVHLAQVDETRARVFLAEGRATEAERLAGAAVGVLERGGEQSLLAEALTTQGVALAHLGRSDRARRLIQRAVEAAERAGDREGAGQAALALIEELGETMASHDLSETYNRAADLLAASQHPGIKDRLIACARRVQFLSGLSPVPPSWEGFSLRRAVCRYEAFFIERALKDSGGVVARAARLLDIKRQSLNSILHTRHRNLIHLRATAQSE